jgi:hypothetical protein
MNREALGAGLLIALIVMGYLFLYALLGTLIGAFSGWILSLTPLGPMVEEGLTLLGVQAKGKITVIGAMLGFIAGFFRQIVKVERKND